MEGVLKGKGMGGVGVEGRLGCQDLVSAAMLYNCYQQMEGKWGYQLGFIFSL